MSTLATVRLGSVLLPQLVELIWTTRSTPAKAVDFTLPLDQVAECRRPWTNAAAIKTLLQP